MWARYLAPVGDEIYIKLRIPEILKRCLLNKILCHWVNLLDGRGMAFVIRRIIVMTLVIILFNVILSPYVPFTDSLSPDFLSSWVRQWMCNILQGFESAFARHDSSTVNTLAENFDYRSIMMYDEYAFSKVSILCRACLIIKRALSSVTRVSLKSASFSTIFKFCLLWKS